MKPFSTCPHLGACSGCIMPFGGSAKPPLWKRVEAFFARPLPLFSASHKGWRLRAKLAVRGTLSAPCIGLFRKGTHDVLSLPDCHAHHPSINQATELILAEMLRLKISPYDELRHKGHLRYLQFFVCRKSATIQLVLVGPTQAALAPLAAALAHSALFHSIWINEQSAKTNRIFGDGWHHICGPASLIQPIGRASVSFHPAAFAQAHLSLFDQLLATLETWILPHRRLLEIYAGAGGISLHLAPYLQEALLIEENPYAFFSFTASKPPPSFRYLQADALAAMAHLASYDLILLDPPRKGLDPRLLEALCDLSDKTLITIYCSFESFERDAKELLSSGWQIVDAAGFWLFPGTDQIELAVKWSKGK